MKKNVTIFREVLTLFLLAKVNVISAIYPQYVFDFKLCPRKNIEQTKVFRRSCRIWKFGRIYLSINYFLYYWFGKTDIVMLILEHFMQNCIQTY